MKKLAFLFLVFLFGSQVSHSVSANLVNGGSVTGSLDTGSEMDNYTFTLDSDDSAFIRLTSTSGSYTPLLVVLAPNGDQLVDNGDHAVLSVPALRYGAGEYRLTVTSFGPFFTAGDYEIQFVKAPGANEKGKISSAETVTGSMSTGNLDTYTLDAVAGNSILLRVSPIDNAFTPDIVLYAPSGRVVGADNSGDALIYRRAPETGTYTFLVTYKNTISNGDYRLEFAKITGDSKGDSLNDVRTKEGELEERGDLDSYTFELEKGADFSVQLSVLGGTSTARLMIYAPDGSFVTAKNNSKNAVISLTAEQTGFYTAVVTYQNQFGQPGPYEIALSAASMRITQAVFKQESGPVKLVHGRTTAIIVDTGPSIINDNVSVVITDKNTGMDITINESKPGRNSAENIFYCIPNNIKDPCNLRLGGIYEFSLKLEDGRDLVPNQNAVVMDTRMLELFFYGILNTSCVNNAKCGFDGVIEQEIEKANAFVSRVYPLADDGLFSVQDIKVNPLGSSYRGNLRGNEKGEVAFDFAPINSAYDAIRADVRMLDEKRVDKSVLFQRGVGFVQNGYFKEKIQLWPNSNIPLTAKGVFYTTTKSALVEISGNSAQRVAHEIGHSFGLRLPKSAGGTDEEYNVAPNGIGFPAEGFDVYHDTPLFKDSSSTYNYMAAEVVGSTYWVNNETWDSTFQTLSSTVDDPNLIYISLDLYSNGRVQAYNWLETTGFPNTSDSGSHSVQVLSIEDEVLFDYKFTPAFNVIIEPVGALSVEAIPVTLLAEYPNNSKSVVVKDDKGAIVFREDPLIRTIRVFARKLTNSCEFSKSAADQINQSISSIVQDIQAESYFTADQKVKDLSDLIDNSRPLDCNPNEFIASIDKALTFLENSSQRITQRAEISPPIKGDLDKDGDVDRDDLSTLLSSRNQPASGENDPKDLDGDGQITGLDARKLTQLCTRSRCATE